MVQKLYGGRPRGIRVDSELSEVPDSGWEDAEPVVRTGEIAPRDIFDNGSTFSAGWLSYNGNQPVWYYAVDGDPATYIENAGGGAGTLVLRFKGPRLVARIIMDGLFNNVGLEIWDIQTQAWVSVLNLLADATVRDGIDTGNFTPISTNRIRVTFAPASTSERIVDTHILTVQEIKGNIQITPTPPDPANPQFAQLMQQVVNSEATVTSTLPGVPTNILDKDKTTFIGPGSGLTTVDIHSAKLVARVSIVGAGLTGISSVTVFDVNQNPHILTPTVVTDDGWESGNLNPYINTDRVEIVGTSIRINEVSIYKAIEVKIPPISVVIPPVTVSSTPANPLFGQLQQQIVLPGDVNLPESILQSTLLAGSIPDILDKDDTTFATIGGGGVATVIFTHPKQIARVLVQQPEISTPIYDFMVEYRNSRFIWNTLFESTTDLPKNDSDNFGPIMATGVRVISTRALMDIAELIILKSIETKAARNLNMVPAVEVINVPTASIEPGTPVGQFGTTPPFPASLAGFGVEIAKDNNMAINAEVRITGSGAETIIDANLMWYYSDDDITYHYFATTALTDTPGNLSTGNPNPTGYQVAGDTGYRHISQPLTAYNKYIAVVFSNDNNTDPPVSNAVGVLVKLVRQR